MAPSEKAIVAGIYAAIKELHSTNPETLTVRNVRNKAEADLGTESGFLSNESWKEKSKKIIKDYANQLAEVAEEPEIPTPKAKAVAVQKSAPAMKKAATLQKGNKRGAPEAKARDKKRQKKAKSPSDNETSELSEITPSEESAASDFGDSDSDAPKNKKKSTGKAKAPAKSQAKIRANVVSESEDLSDDEKELEDSDDSEAPKKKIRLKPRTRTPVKRQLKSRAKIASSDESEEDLDSEASAPKKKVSKKPTPKKAAPKKSKATVDSDAESEHQASASVLLATPKKAVPNSSAKATTLDSDAEDKPTSKPDDGGSESEMSIVLDPTPKPKRQRAPKGEKKAKDPKVPKTGASTRAKAKASADLSPDEADIKILQSQLNKCGIKKIWQFELKQYGDDNKAKIRHLQNILKEIGMTGRYSDARAREIKEMRELQADLEAVKEGEKAWGLESGRRSRGAAPKRSMKVASEDEEESGEEGATKAARKSRSDDKAGSESDDGDDDQPPARKRRLDPGLAFLSSEEDSDE
ncbi:hypothetical protein WAI453_007305 [Rhynchosporium graminicola]|uniref:Transcriptional regulator n=1 Tax=Rhynchosporium graminicola TaxID=2792576 RepID=A0A1E1LCR0_9HELO|nr:uncharacterized protein RCO7_08259 [Rhynchosporium commune]